MVDTLKIPVMFLCSLWLQRGLKCRLAWVNSSLTWSGLSLLISLSGIAILTAAVETLVLRVLTIENLSASPDPWVSPSTICENLKIITIFGFWRSR